MKAIYAWILIALLGAGTPFSAAGQYDKYLEKAEEAYVEGDYASAAKQIAKMKKKITKKLGAKTPIWRWYWFVKRK